VDDTTKTERQVRCQPGMGPDFDVRAFAKKFEISRAQANRLMKLHGKHSGILVRKAWKLKK
jgi:hypothetical protein